MYASFILKGDFYVLNEITHVYIVLLKVNGLALKYYIYITFAQFMVQLCKKEVTYAKLYILCNPQFQR